MTGSKVAHASSPSGSDSTGSTRANPDPHDDAPVASVVIGRCGSIERANVVAHELLGYDPEELVGMSVFDLHPDETAERLAARMTFDHSIAGEKVVCEMLQMRRKDGDRIWVNSSVHPLPDRDGRVTAIHLMAVDISAKRRALERLRVSEERFRLLVENAGEAFYLIEQDGRISDVNRRAAEDTGYTREELLGMHVWDVSAELSPAQHRGAWERMKAGDETVVGIHRRRDGTTFPVEVCARVFRAEGRDVALALARDLTDQTEARRELLRLTEEKRYLQAEIEAQHSFGDMVGRSAPMLRVFESIDQVAATDATVLITGETGTGKELVARAVHRASGRSERTFVKVNCAALSPALVESEIFGHEKGAFTGALAKRTGRFELANGGTLFLDEIGDLDSELQPKLLRVLQDGTFERVGGTKTLTADARVIAATNRDLHQSVVEGSFRSDLYYRLNVYPIHMPPLRERPEDIPLLVSHFMERYQKEAGTETAALASETLAALEAYDWPGNVREMENVVERAFIAGRTGTAELAESIARSLMPRTAGDGSYDGDRLDDIQRRHIAQVLERTRWQVAGAKGAARVLGLNPSTLRSRMKKLGLEKPA